MSEGKLVKVVLRQEYEDDEEVEVETPWALDLGGGRYQLKNFPFFFYGLSFNDIFEAAPLYPDDERPYFTRVLQKSGHKTLRILLASSIKDDADGLDILAALKAMGCGYEGNGAKFFVINVQPHCDFDGVCNYLNQQKVDWESADPVQDEPNSGEAE